VEQAEQEQAREAKRIEREQAKKAREQAREPYQDLTKSRTQRKTCSTGPA
jgi:hypothetical protein